jgi:hypothetical protein
VLDICDTIYRKQPTKSADKINDPVASGEARAGRVVGAAGGCGNMNYTRTLQVRDHK